MSKQDRDDFDLQAAPVWIDRIEELYAPPELLARMREAVQFYHRFLTVMTSPGHKIRVECSDDTLNLDALPPLNSMPLVAFWDFAENAMLRDRPATEYVQV